MKGNKSKNQLYRNALTLSFRQKKKDRSEILKEGESEVNKSVAYDVDESSNSLEPHKVFKYTNIIGVDENTPDAEKNKQWESFFDPQHTFGSFQQTISGPCHDKFFYNANWPLNQKDLMLDIEDKSLSLSLPTLPKMEDLQLHINSAALENSGENENITGQIEILPRPSRSLFSTPDQPKRDENKWKEKLELLQLIRQYGFNDDMDGSRYNPSEISTPHRPHKNIFNTTTTTTEWVKRETKQAIVVRNCDNASLSSLGDGYHKCEDDLELRENAKKSEQLHETNYHERSRSRISFLYFIFGFIFPPLWIIGALYVPRYSSQRTATSIEIDKKWKKYSRNAFLIFLISVMSTAILIFIIKPSFVGYRSSHKESHSNEDPIIFDEGK